MKNIAQLAALAAIAFALTNCKEQRIEIPPLGTGIASERKVLIEEFTGVKCQACPQGSAEIVSLLDIYKENLIAVSIHAGDFSNPLPQSKFDFRTDEGTALEAFLGKPIAYPSGVVDRKSFPPAPDLQAFRQQWAGRIQANLQVDPGLAINLAPNFNPATRQLSLELTILPSKNLPGSHRFSIMITENHIIDWQTDGADEVEDYEHEHVLRDMLTPFDGSQISEDLKKGVPVKRQFTFAVPTEWKPENCHIVAFVHHGGIPDREVLQAEEVPFY